MDLRAFCTQWMDFYILGSILKDIIVVISGEGMTLGQADRSTQQMSKAHILERRVHFFTLVNLLQMCLQRHINGREVKWFYLVQKLFQFSTLKGQRNQDGVMPAHSH